jgi:hypothetical protein
MSSSASTCRFLPHGSANVTRARSTALGDRTFKLGSGTTSGYGRYVKSLGGARWRALLWSHPIDHSLPANDYRIAPIRSIIGPRVSMSPLPNNPHKENHDGNHRIIEHQKTPSCNLARLWWRGGPMEKEFFRGQRYGLPPTCRQHVNNGVRRARCSTPSSYINE